VFFWVVFGVVMAQWSSQADFAGSVDVPEWG
jgi:hypothetical protein